MNKNYRQATDNQLVEFSKENPEAFGEIVLRYQNRLFSYIKRISYFSNEDIEDIIQEVFLKVYKNLNSFDGDFSFSTWIYQISRNATIDAIRKKQTRPQIAGLEETEMIKIFRSSVDLKEEFESQEGIKEISKIINNLPYKYKEVMILKFLEEKSYEEIMDIVKKPKGTVGALIARGRKKIMKQIENSDYFKKNFKKK